MIHDVASIVAEDCRHGKGPEQGQKYGPERHL